MGRRLIATLLFLQPALSGAQVIPGSDSDSTAFVLQVKRPFQLAAGDRVGGLLIVSDTAVIDGTVTDQLVVINGTARVRGTVRNTVVVVHGRLELAPSARVGHDVLLYRSTLTRAPGATVGGAVHERTAGFTFSERALLLVWLSMTVAVIAAGLLFATVGRAQLADAVARLRHHTGQTLLAALVLWLGLPVLAVLALMSGIGIPLGIGIFVVLLPALWFLGYLVTAALAGGALLRRLGRPATAQQSYAPMLVGLLTLQVLGLVPGIGGIVAMFAGLVGAGALAARAWETQRAAGVVSPMAPLPSG